MSRPPPGLVNSIRRLHSDGGYKLMAERFVSYRARHLLVHSSDFLRLASPGLYLLCGCQPPLSVFFVGRALPSVHCHRIRRLRLCQL